VYHAQRPRSEEHAGEQFADHRRLPDTPEQLTDQGDRICNRHHFG
jgi:hypothetical protein